jgi:hypothetical protein
MKTYNMKLVVLVEFLIATSSILVSHVSYTLILRIKKEIFENFLSSNLQPIPNNIYALFYLTSLSKDMIFLQELISWMLPIEIII